LSALGEAVFGAVTRALATVDASASLRGLREGVAVREGVATREGAPALAGAVRGCVAVRALVEAVVPGVGATAPGLRP